jgi:hypothetical protein
VFSDSADCYFLGAGFVGGATAGVDAGAVCGLGAGGRLVLAGLLSAPSCPRPGWAGGEVLLSAINRSPVVSAARLAAAAPLASLARAGADWPAEHLRSF